MNLPRIAVCFLLAVLGSCAPVRRPDFSPPPPNFRVVTYNVNWGCPKPDAVTAYLRDSGADFVFLQETHPDWEHRIAADLGSTYPHRIFHHEGGAGGIAVLSKSPLLNQRILPAKAGWFPALLVETKSPLGRVQCLNVHLRPPLGEDGSVSASGYLKAPSVHRHELAAFVTAVPNGQPCLIAGDFNEHEDKAGVAYLSTIGFSDALSEFDTTTATWTWPVFPGITLKNRYDHILFRGPLRCAGAKVVPVHASDHHPVAAVFTRPTETAPDAN
ncbi:MAG: endonuclease/exonuclease/phosphatase family protein [Verrucomicrobia bacterium]|nr:endonuclease/exonuclease/phosphatase family protein [Verrucomicrobiota bacterium]